MPQLIPSAAQIATSHNWISSSSAYDMAKPTNDPNLYKAFGEQNITGLTDILGSRKAVAGLSFRHFEEDRLQQTVKCNAQTAPGNNTAQVLTVASAYTMTSYPSTYSPYIAPSTTINAPNASGTTTLHGVRVGEGIMYPNNVRGTVTARTATTFTVTPDVEGAAGALPAVSTTDELVLLGITNGEGGSSPETLNYRLQVVEGVMQIMAEAAEASGSSMGEQIWVTTEGLNGEMGNAWYYKNQRDTYIRFKNQREVAYVSGKKVSSTSALAVIDATRLKTDGIYTLATSYNGAINYTIASGLSKDKFENLIINTLDKNKGAIENSVWASIRVRQQIDSFVGQEMQAGAVQYNAFKGGKDQAVNFGFNGISMLGYTFQLKTYSLLNDPGSIGANVLYANSALVIPLDKQAYIAGEQKEKITTAAISLNYVKRGDYNRDMEEFLLGGANGVYTNSRDAQSINFRTHFGAEMFGANRFALLQGL